MNTNGNDGKDRKKRHVCSTTTPDPAFDPAGVVEVNGYCFVAAGEVEGLREALEKVAKFTEEPLMGYAVDRSYIFGCNRVGRWASGIARAALAGGAK